MMKLVNNRIIDCIIVKDLSRFARNYLEAGNYLEHIFPFMQVRFISINDNYDSKYSTNISSIEIGFKNMLSEMYSLDLSKKIKSTKERQRNDGLFTGGLPPYGYKLAYPKSHKLVIDEEAAVVIRRIFNMRYNGMSYSTIAKILNEEKIPTPGVYKYGENNKASRDNIWKPDHISRIIGNEVYVGKIISYKYKSIKTSKGIKNYKTESVITENAHEAIIEEDIFYKINKPRKNKTKSEKRHLFAGKIKCSVCEYNFQAQKGKTVQYSCKKRSMSNSGKCYNGKLDEINIARFVIKEYSKLINESEKASKECIASNEQKNYKDYCNSLERKIERLKLQKFNLFEKYASNAISLNDYSERNNIFDEKIKELENNLIKFKMEYKKTNDSNRDTLPQISEIKELDRETLDKIVDIIWVDSNGNFEIKWKF